jgi:hypothetical protein
MRETLSRKYILILAAVALGILILGGLLRPKKPATEAPSPSEMASLQRKVRREQVGDMGQFLADRAAAAAEHVIYVADLRASGVIWGRRGQALIAAPPGSATSSAPLSLIQTASASAPAPTAGGINPERWILVVGRSADQQPLWTSALDGGSKPASCNGIDYRELVLSTPLDSSLAGAGAFDLDGNLVGIVARCGESYHLISVASIPTVLNAGASPKYKLMTRYGFRTIPLNAASEAMQELFPSQPGLLVTDVWKASAADIAGLAAGDLIIAAAGVAALSEATLWEALEKQTPLTLTTVRSGRRREIQLNAATSESGAGIRVSPPMASLPVISVTPGTPAYLAGLRSGDRIVMIGGRQNPGIAEVRRILSGTKEGQSVLVVYERDSRESLAVVSK